MDFIARGAVYTLFLTRGEAVLRLGGREQPAIRWRTEAPHFSNVRYRNIYRGIDLVYYGKERKLEYDFVVSPGADPGAIGLRLTGS